MAIKAGLTLLEIIQQYVRRLMMGKGSGILKIPPKKDVNKFAKDLLKKFKEHGVSDSAVNNPKDVKIIWEQITQKEARIMQNNMEDLLKEMDAPLTSKKPADVHPFTGFTPKVIKGGKPKEGIGTLFKDSPERIKQIKAENKAAAQRLRDKKKTVEDFSDDGDWDPSGMASGGLARVGMFAGGLIKLAQLKKMFPRIHVDSLLEASRIKDPNKLKQMLNSFRKTEQSIDEAPSVELFDFDPTDRLPNATGGLARVGFGLGKLVLKDLPEWAVKQFKHLNELKSYYSKLPPNNKDTLDLFNKVVIQRQKALRHTLEVGGDEKMFNRLRIGPHKDIPDIGQKVKFSEIPTDEPKTMRNVKGQFGFDFAEPQIGQFTKAEVLIKRLENTIKESKDPYVQETFPNFIKEIKANPKLANNENVWKELGGDLPYNQRLIVHSDDSVTFQTRKGSEPKLSKPTKTLEGLKKEGTIDISNPEVADEFSRFMKESDPKGYKKLENQINYPLSPEEIKGKKLADSMSDAEIELRDEFPGITDEMINNILTDKNPQRIAEVKQTMREAFKMQEKGMSPDDIIKIFKDTTRTKQASGGIAGQLHLNEGGRVPMIFGGSAGLKGLIASIKAGLNKGRTEKIKTLFPKYSVEEKELLKLGEKYLPKDAATLAAKEIQAKAEGIQVLIDRLKHDKKLLKQQAKNKAMNDPNLDFLMESLEKTMPEAYGPHLKKYTNIDKDILQLETIKKNITMKDRKLHASGGIAGQLHMNQGGRARYAQGSRQPGLETSTSRAKQEQQQRDIRGLQQAMADRGGGDAQAYVRQHELSQTPDRTMGLGTLIKKMSKRPRRPRPPPWKRLPPPNIFRHMFREPPSKKIYQTEEDIPEGVLELLQKDPNFNMKDFLETQWKNPGYRWTDTNPRTKGLRGSYHGMTGDITLGMAPFGQKEYVKWFPKNPHGPDIALRDVDKAKIVSHELRHKNIIEDPDLFASQPDWVRKNMWGIDYSQEPDEGGPYPFAEKLPKDYRTPYMTGHELYNRYLDQTFYPPEEKPGPNEPYFDKILSDLWQPSAEEYKRISQLNKDPLRKSVPYKAGGRVSLSNGGLANILGV